MKILTHLNYGGNCRQAFEFYQQHLGGKIAFLMTFGQTPGGSPFPGMDDGVLHARLDIGETALLGNDVPADRFQPMRSVYIGLYADSTEEAERVHALLAEGGEILMPMQETFFAFRFSSVRDRFGTSWMILHSRPMPADSAAPSA